MKQESEKQLVTDYLKDRLVEAGWRFVAGNSLERSGLDEPLLVGNLRASLSRLNSHLDITEKEIDDVVQEIKLVPAGESGCRQMLHYFKYGIGVKFYQDKIVKIVNLFDFANPKNNEFIISREVCSKGSELVRADIILYVNGIPLANIEGKNPLSLTVSWQDGYRQIKKYERLAPEAYKYIQIGAAVDAEARYFAIAPWMENVETYEWKEDGLDSVESLVKFLQPERILDILRNFLFVREEKGSFNKVIARYMQYRAVNKICERVANHLEGKDEKNKGLIWHWQGSGKTLTMIFAAHKLYFHKLLEGPTIFFIIDRKDLEEQLSNELSSLDLNFGYDTIGSVNDLVGAVQADNYQGKRGMFITLLHKFEAGRQWLPIDFDDEKKTTISDRKNVICFLDEVHRTQYGLLAAQMKHILRDAFYFGFTGTPVDEKERDTYREFGYPVDSEDYLDKYFINESLTDGFTVPVVFMPRQETLHYSAEIIKAIHKSESEDPFGDEEMEDRVARKLNVKDAFLENEQRIGKISEDIAEHFKEYISGRFKAMVVCGSRKACVMYKNKLDELLGVEVSEIIMTFNVGDQKDIADYYEKWKNKYPAAKLDKDIRDEIVRRFKDSVSGSPKILIVTDMLLTGFDAPMLQTMYFDKPIKKHRLLQAIARVNRPYKDIKKAGMIVDYVGILKEAKRAHKMYYEDEKGTTVPFEYEYLEDSFKELIKGIQEVIGKTPKKINREILIASMDRLRDEQAEKRFLENYRESRKIFELLGNRNIKLDYLDDYKFYSAIFAYLRKLKGEDKEDNKIYFSKTLDVVHKAISIEEINKDLPTFSFDVSYFDSIIKTSLGKKEKAMNIVFALERMVLVEKTNNPVLRSVFEKVEKLVRKWRERSIDYEEVYDEVVAVAEEIKAKEKEKKELGLNDVEFGIYEMVSRKLGDNKKSLDLAKDMYGSMRENIITGWEGQAVLRQNVSRVIREKVRQLKTKEGLSLYEINDLSKTIFESVEEYAKEDKV